MKPKSVTCLKRSPKVAELFGCIMEVAQIQMVV